MRNIIIIIILMIPIISASKVFAHGSKYELIKTGIGIKALYHDDSPMSDSDVEVFSPVDNQKKDSTGNTDEYGRFYFFPDKTGKWRIKVSDGMGHAVEALLDVKEGMVLEDKPGNSHGGFSTEQLIIMVLCVVWGFIGTGLYFKRK